MNRSARNMLVVSALLMALFFANLITGKIRLLSGTGIAAPLDGVPEFILLMLAVGFFVAGLLALENDKAGDARDGPPGGPDSHSGNNASP